MRRIILGILCAALILVTIFLIVQSAKSTPLPQGWQKLTDEQLAEKQTFLARYQVYCSPYAGTTRGNLTFIKATMPDSQPCLISIEELPIGIKIDSWPLDEPKEKKR